MRVVIQRVSRASVQIDYKTVGKINHGILVLLGITHDDKEEDAIWLCNKISQMRIFLDDDQKMNRNIVEVDGNALVVSQFTLHASTKKGNRPSFIRSASPEVAKKLYEFFITNLSERINAEVQSGKFGAMMEVELVNSGPVTITMDSKNRE